MISKKFLLFISLLTVCATPLLAKEEVMGEYVGELQEKWQFPSDHLPVGMSIDDIHIASWNVLSSEYIGWVTEKDSQGLGRSMIAEEHIYIDGSELTVRDQHVGCLILEMICHPTHPRSILCLQECSDPFLQDLAQHLPPHFSLIEEGENAILFDNAEFSIVENKIISNVFSDTPKRTFQEITLQSKKTNQLLKITNVHIPGNPQKPGRFEFARYLAASHNPLMTHIATGDMNFNEHQMKEALHSACLSSFSLLTPYCTNISPYTYTSKAIDHFILYTAQPTAFEVNAPEALLSNLPSLVKLLMPTTYPLPQFHEIIEVFHEEKMPLRTKAYHLMNRAGDALRNLI